MLLSLNSIVLRDAEKTLDFSTYIQYNSYIVVEML
jgi:hypothetical protein